MNAEEIIKLVEKPSAVKELNPAWKEFMGEMIIRSEPHQILEIIRTSFAYLGMLVACDGEIDVLPSTEGGAQGIDEVIAAFNRSIPKPESALESK